MAALDAAASAVHLLFGGLWAGAVVFVAVAVLPTAQDGTANAEPLSRIVGALRWLSRASAAVVLLTGAHMAVTGYTVATLAGTTRGHLVLAMVGLWVLLIGLVEVGAGRLADGFDRRKVREPASAARPFVLAAAAVAAAALVVGGLLASGVA